MYALVLKAVRNESKNIQRKIIHLPGRNMKRNKIKWTIMKTISVKFLHQSLRERQIDLGLSARKKKRRRRRRRRRRRKMRMTKSMTTMTTKRLRKMIRR